MDHVAPNNSWSVDSPFTMFATHPGSQEAMAQARARANQRNPSANTSPTWTGVQHQNEPSPSDSSHYTEPWPPSITRTQQATYRLQQTSPSQVGLTPPENSGSPPPLYGNSALGVVSGQYIPDPTAHLTPNTHPMSYSTSPSVNPSAASPDSQDMYKGNRPVNLNAYAQNTAWGPTEVMPPNQDMPMLDIDWSEWDKLFPIEMNNGELDMPRNIPPAQ